MLYQVVSRNIQAFFKKCEESGHPVPKFIKREFECFLRCGVLSYGFARVYCQSCKYDLLVGFSCKKRGFCASCLSRRISEISGHLVDEVMPEIPTRQWVLSVPVPLRYLMAYDNEALNAVTSAFMGSVFTYLRSKAKKHGGIALDAEAYFPGSVSFIQRFGSALNLNVHIHSQVSDGAFVRLPSRIRFIRTPSPNEEEEKHITIKIARRVHRYLEKRMSDSESDALVEKEPLLAKCYAASIRYCSALGNNAGKPLERLISLDLIRETSLEDRTILGFNLHASDAIEADDRAALERTLRYMGRPPLSKDRLMLAPDGNHLVLTLKTPWRNGVEKIMFLPFDLIERLVGVIPPPRKNQIRYHGFLAPNSNERKEIIAKRAVENHHKANKKIRRPANACLMARVFSIDILECPRCKSQMQLISCVQDPKAIRDILRSLKMSTAPPNECELYDWTIEYDTNEPDHAADKALPNTKS